MTGQEIEAALEAAMKAHENWRSRLSQAVTSGTLDDPPEIIRRSDCCEFGRWIEGSSIDDTMRSGKPWQVTRRLHSEFHEAAGRVASLVAEGELDEARNALNGLYLERANRLSAALNLWQDEVRNGTHG